MRVLIVYGTNQGQTAKIAQHIARTLRELEAEVDILDGRLLAPQPDLDHYDALIVGASVIAGRFQQYIVEFVMAQRAQLRRMPTAFFSVSLTEADPHPHKHARAHKTIARFLEHTGWQPLQVASFAGSMAYLRYRWLMRLIWHGVALPIGDEASAPDAYEYTDWDAVTRFATQFAARARATQLAAGQLRGQAPSRPLDYAEVNGA